MAPGAKQVPRRIEGGHLHPQIFEGGGAVLLEVPVGEELLPFGRPLQGEAAQDSPFFEGKIGLAVLVANDVGDFEGGEIGRAGAAQSHVKISPLGEGAHGGQFVVIGE